MSTSRLLRIITLFEVINSSLADVHCYPGNKSSVPLLSGCNNQVTIEGENVTFKCSFGDDYLPVDYNVSWKLTLENGDHIIIEDDMNYTDFCLHTYQDCPPNNSSCCRFTSELSIHTNLSMNNAAVSCNAMINEHTTSSTCHLNVVMRPTIVVPLTNIRAEEGKTVNLECLVTAITMSGWTLFTWRKNSDVINSNPHKYNISKEINPYGDNKNSIQFILTIYNTSKEDEANYTLVVYYDTYVLKQYNIVGDYFSQTTGSLQLVDIDNKGSKGNNSLIIIIISSAVATAVLLVIILTIIVMRARKPSSGRNAPGERTRLIGSDNHTREHSPVPATGDTTTTTVAPESQDGPEERFHSGRRRDDDLQTDRPLNSHTSSAGNSALTNYRPHMQAIRDHVVCKVAHKAFDLALEFGISEEEASDLAKNGDGQIKIFRIWLKKGPQTWKVLLKLLHKLNEHKLADELQGKLENKVILSEMLAEKPSMYSLHDVIQRVAPYSRDIAIELGLDDYYRIVETDHPNNCVLRCQKLFERFLEGANPTWEEVVRSIRAVNFIVIANDIEKQLPEMLDEEEMRCATLEHEPLKIDMLTLLLSTQSDFNKIPLSDRAYGWLVDVRAIVKRISCFVQFNNTELNMIHDPKLEPNHRSVCLARLIKDKGKSKGVYRMLRDLYCVTQTVQGNQPAAATTVDVPSNEATSQPTSVHHYYYYGVPSMPVTGNYSGLVPGIQAMEIAKSFDNPLCHKTIDFFQLVDPQTLALHLYQGKLLTEDDFERVQLPHMTRSDRANFLYLKLVHLGKEQFEIFMKCLEDADEHMGHGELYHKLSTPQ